MKIEWTPSTVIESLQPQVDEILKALTDIIGNKHLKNALISDMSTIQDFLSDRRDTGETQVHPLHPDKQIKLVAYDTPVNRMLVAQLSDRLGIKVEIEDHLYEVALKLRG